MIDCRAIIASIQCITDKPNKKVKEGNDQETGQSERNSHSKTEEIDDEVPMQREHIVSRVSSYFPIDDNSVTLTIVSRSYDYNGRDMPRDVPLNLSEHVHLCELRKKNVCFLK